MVSADEPGDRRSYLRDPPALPVENGLGGEVGSGRDQLGGRLRQRDPGSDEEAPEEGGAGGCRCSASGQLDDGKGGEKVTRLTA